MSYKIRLNIFEGPFDLLVYLIERAEMSIYDIEISLITRQYLEHIRRLEESDVAVGSEFMVLAATLIDIKSKMLLPRLTPEGVEEADPRTDLTQKLVEYVRFKKAAAALEALREVAKLRMEKPQEDLQPYTGDPDIYLKMDMEQFVQAFHAFVHRRRKNEELMKMRRHIERERVSLESKMDSIKKLLAAAKGGWLRFTDFLSGHGRDDGAGGADGAGAGAGAGADAGDGGAERKGDLVVTFIALLDMARGGEASAKQEENFGEILVRKGQG